MNKFDVYERLWQEVKSEESFLPEADYSEEDYQLYKKLFKQYLRMTVDAFQTDRKMHMSNKDADTSATFINEYNFGAMNTASS